MPDLEPEPDSEMPRERRLYRRLLRLLPFEFRSEFGDEMEEAFGEQRRHVLAGRWGRIRLWWATLRDLIRTAPNEHWDVLKQDLRFALRSLRRSRVLTATALATLVLAVGIHGAVFQVVSTTLFAEPPFDEADRLMMVWSAHPENGWDRSRVSLQAFEVLREAESLESMAVWNGASGNLTGGRTPERVSYALASDRLFSLRGVEPALGRDFLEGEDRPGRPPVAVVSHGFWSSRLAADPAAVGRPVTLDGEAVTVIGVLPAAFTFPGDEGFELYRTLGLAGDDAGEGRWLLGLGRLSSGATAGAAQQELAGLATAIAERRPETETGWTFRLEPLREAMVRGLAPRLIVLWGLVGLVLVIASINLASLYLARSTAREGELSVRAALGARRLRVVRQLLTESSVLGLVGGALSLPVAAGALRAVEVLDPEILPPGAAGLDMRSVLVAVGAATGVSLLAALPAALRASHIAAAGTLPSSVRSSTGRTTLRLRSALVAAEVAAASVVLIAAGLLLKSFSEAAGLDPGFDQRSLLTARIEPAIRFEPEGGSMEEMIRAYEAEMARASTFYQDLLERIESLPGVEAAGAVNRRPLKGGWDSSFAAEGRPAPPTPPKGNERVVTPGYFEAAGIDLVAGRALDRRDGPGAPRSAVVSQALADALWPGEEPLGRRLTSEVPPGPHTVWYTVVGVASDVRIAALESDPPPTFYRTVAQTRGGFFQDLGMDLVVRGPEDPLALLPSIRRVVRDLDPDLPVFAAAAMDRTVWEALAPRRALTLLVLAFAGLAAALAAVGIYGVLAYAVGLRRRELGIRIALGARKGAILRLVLGSGMSTVGLGWVAGAVGAATTRRGLSSQLFGVDPLDPATYAGVAVILALMGLLASWLPARRAARTDPMEALSE